MPGPANDERPERRPMDIVAEVIAPHLEPLVRAAGHAYEGTLVAEKWTRTRDGNWIVLVKLGNGGDKFGDGYMHLRGATLYRLRLGDYFHSRTAAEKAYTLATRAPYREPTPAHERPHAAPPAGRA